MINNSITQDHQGCDTLGADLKPHHHFLSENFCFRMTLPHTHHHRHRYDLLLTDVHFRIYRHHQCHGNFHQKTEFLRYLLFGNLFEGSLQTVSVGSFDHQKVMNDSIIFL